MMVTQDSAIQERTAATRNRSTVRRPAKSSAGSRRELQTIQTDLQVRIEQGVRLERRIEILQDELDWLREKVRS